MSTWRRYPGCANERKQTAVTVSGSAIASAQPPYELRPREDSSSRGAAGVSIGDCSVVRLAFHLLSPRRLASLPAGRKLNSRAACGEGSVS